MDEISRKINILLNVEKSFVPKAEYVLRGFCKTLGLQPEFFYGFSLDDIHIYYGIDTDEDYPIEIRFQPETAEFFKKKKSYSPNDIHYYLFDNEYLPFLFSRRGPIFHHPKDKIILRKDIVASAFYFLSCWDEHIENKKQKKKQMETVSNLALSLGFAELPVVDRYCDIFLSAVRKVMAGYQKENKLLTDSDLALSIAHLINCNDQVKKHSAKKIMHLTENILRFESRKGISSTFFMPILQESELVSSPTNAILSLLTADKKKKQHSKAEKQEIAVFADTFPDPEDISHSIDSYSNEEKQVSGFCLLNLNTHYSTLFNTLEKTPVSYDCSIYYAEHGGYRAGTALPYQPFNIKENRPFSILEIPPVLFIKMSEVKSPNKNRTLPVSILEKIMGINGFAKLIESTHKKKSLAAALHHIDCLNINSYRKGQLKKICCFGMPKNASFISYGKICNSILT